MTYLAYTSISGKSDLSGQSYVDTSAFVDLPSWIIPMIVSYLSTTIAILAGSDGGVRSTKMSNVPHFVAIDALQYPASSIMMKATLVTFRERSVI